MELRIVPSYRDCAWEGTIWSYMVLTHDRARVRVYVRAVCVSQLSKRYVLTIRNELIKQIELVSLSN